MMLQPSILILHPIQRSKEIRERIPSNRMRPEELIDGFALIFGPAVLLEELLGLWVHSVESGPRDHIDIQHDDVEVLAVLDLHFSATSERFCFVFDAEDQLSLTAFGEVDEDFSAGLSHGRFGLSPEVIGYFFFEAVLVVDLSSSEFGDIRERDDLVSPSAIQNQSKR